MKILKLTLISVLLSLFAATAFAQTSTNDLYPTVEFQGNDLVFQQGTKRIVLQTYNAIHSDVFYNNNIVVFKGLNGQGVYLYSISKDKMFVLASDNINNDGLEYFGFQVQENKLILNKVSLSSYEVDYCIYDLPEITDYINQNTITSDDISSEIEQANIGYCNPSDETASFNLEFTNSNTIKFVENSTQGDLLSNYEQKVYLFGDIFTSDWLGNNKQKEGELIHNLSVYPDSPEIFHTIGDYLPTNGKVESVSPDNSLMIYASYLESGEKQLFSFNAENQQSADMIFYEANGTNITDFNIRNIFWSENSNYVGISFIHVSRQLLDSCLFENVNNVLEKKYCMNESNTYGKTHMGVVSADNDGTIEVFRFPLSGIVPGNSYEAREVYLDGSNMMIAIFRGVQAEITFSDIFIDNYLFNYVYFAQSQGWISGYPDRSFKPDNPVNRVEFAKMLMLAFEKGDGDGTNLANFPDVYMDQWYIPVLSRTVALGVMEGYPDGHMRPGNAINQAEALKMVYETAINEDLIVMDGDEWFDKYVRYAESNWTGLSFLSGNENIGNEMTRGDCVELISTLLL